ncbi:undecaprenyldiphospho-muramoylpentapeptide beta-N-acetylglucosaminyltransferase [Sporolactobacillus terrae]|uniref:UDP-N-acetylglucosamine--N-acetylmuramyl-(pentapeptide) pyrophosphoryl-undecaprenol N-acetylglucosamine transferase n=1 Tax=Sporolactobacillus terrae TaxID=269673 RepID=A0A410D528_9BACL|nr:undecaprenyldiphospho-muramoylpentapeptide beta-N-acetylglucosaminyltransferase [Sporolactobacillus terrae]QAA21192.1 undecaprenyldiphospho-muramoylpentapeptide beta-N-acetylglucosaminyltransferase [Sporolactobacillus terrae]QAA24165.1 undecaprenyldiphospho-muramoylpentapeptide beta-N-acetylglucosaminyltransferase [Sporolactobacillus terrae]UAK15973.1 undecaprenyldiphospho-muramoylpentapeptide beta-N-acetylglucosaminyltransferase [Sporolactobacillus terrae]BBN97329.1 UDP-N-acetylglucosamine-
MAKKIVFTGGGSAGHVTPNLALIDELKDCKVTYIGSKNGIEKNLVTAHGIEYHSISSGKLRRYFDMKNFGDPFKVLAGVMQAYWLLKKIKPDVIFSKGGFVSVPVVIGGWLNRIPVYIHESDITPGLANKIAIRFATKLFVTFEEAGKQLPKEKVVYTGAPIRDVLLKGERKKGLDFLGFSGSKPVLLIMGGSLGAKKINDVVRASITDLLKKYQIVHLCGKGFLDQKLAETPGYKQFEFIDKALPDVMAASTLIVSRAGSNAIFEFLALKKPMVLIPLPLHQSRGDQILNADSFKKKGLCEVLDNDTLTSDALLQTLDQVYVNRYDYRERMVKAQGATHGIENILTELNK